MADRRRLTVSNVDRLCALRNILGFTRDSVNCLRSVAYLRGGGVVRGPLWSDRRDLHETCEF